MVNFEFYSPTKVIFGKDVVSGLGREAAGVGRRALLVYGGGSIHKSGLYGRICSQLEDAGIEWSGFGGVQPNPVLSHAEKGVEAAKAFGADFILAAGGGSVIDESKAIAAGFFAEAPLWDYFLKKAVVRKALPVVAVQTLPATSSETNQAAVLTNEETREKIGLRSPHIVPVKAFLDPCLTFTIPADYTAYACFDIMSHMLEGYFTTTSAFAPVHDGFVEGLVCAVMESLGRILNDPQDYEARAAVMWAGALAWNGLANAGLPGAAIPNHMLEHPMSSVYNVPHGAGLAVVFPAWLEYRKREISGRILRFGERILGMEHPGRTQEAAAVDRIIESFRSWLKSAGCPLTMGELGIKDPDLDELTAQAFRLAGLWNISGYTEKDIRAIYSLCI